MNIHSEVLLNYWTIIKILEQWIQHAGKKKKKEEILITGVLPDSATTCGPAW